LFTTNGNENRTESSKNELLSDWVMKDEIKRDLDDKAENQSKILEVLSFGEVSLSLMSII